MKAAEAMKFVVECMCQAEADGYQQFEEEGNVIPDNATPDEWGRDGPVVLLRFGEEWFRLSMTKVRK